MGYDVRIVHEPGRDLMVTPFYTTTEEVGKQIGPGLEKVSGFLHGRGAPPAGPGVAYYERGPEGLVVAVGFTVPREISGGDDIITLHLPDTEVATTTYAGSYQDLASAYDALKQGAAEQGRAVDESGGTWEEYWSEPGSIPWEVRAEVFWPLAPG